MKRLGFHFFRLSLSVILISGGWSVPTLARPEYAVKEKLQCISCHVTPWGGGPRTVMGKTYGSHGHSPAKTSTSDLYYGSVRFLGYYATKLTEQRANGLTLMEASATANVPVIQNEDGSEMRGVLTYNMATLGSPAPREAYVRWLLTSTDNRPAPSIVLGRFYAPFGLLTDEHRAYTRIQTNMSFNNFDVGATFSIYPSSHLRFDLSLVSDFQTGGTFNQGELPFGMVGNLQWNPESIPFLFGISGNYERTLNSPQPVAGSLYTALSLDQLTSSAVSGSLLFEGVLARNWNNPKVNTGLANPSLSQFFIPPENASYLSQVLRTSSLGWFGQFKYNLTHVWTLLYRFDYLALDTLNSDANYTRNGIGFEAYLNSNLIWNTRYEFATFPGFIRSSNNSTLATQNAVFSMLRLWI